jgi:hypothetical protein
MALYLVKLDPQRRDARGEPRLQVVIGRVIECPAGHRFLPATSAHKGSRKYWPDAVSCIPAWAGRTGFTRLYDRAEPVTGVTKPHEQQTIRNATSDAA